jgi:tRNA pseudouridine55 synthase
MLPLKDILSSDFADGSLLLVDKPLRWTSFDVVNKIRYALRPRFPKIKVGHAGTLDPLATGLLLICTGKYTKRIESLSGMDKSYTGTIKLGATTFSYDAELEESAFFPVEHINEDMLQAAAAALTGDIMQVPPLYSAIKLEGQAAYHVARKGGTLELAPRALHISQFDIDSTAFPNIRFKVQCSKGTYIRSLAHDFGKALNSGAYLTELCRTSVGPFLLEDAWPLEELIEVINQIPKPDKA